MAEAVEVNGRLGKLARRAVEVMGVGRKLSEESRKLSEEEVVEAWGSCWRPSKLLECREVVGHVGSCWRRGRRRDGRGGRKLWESRKKLAEAVGSCGRPVESCGRAIGRCGRAVGSCPRSQYEVVGAKGNCWRQ
ncbi:hypothetical protein FNV43_RR26999 [Rhamnella rubrinervis]|uniref:Uncharacterized protein n=1 Tax=Rhamnella rubrinervis TaxID=2594499 RepID=A0A8K0DJT1_9ROSA|nr:hypothetical protein FNV43_RR26999 [Rhamnella rubrinervis]